MRLESKGKMAQVQGFPGSNLLKVNIPETTFTLKRKTQEPSSPKNGNMWFEAATEPQRTLVILMRKALTEKKNTRKTKLYAGYWKTDQAYSVSGENYSEYSMSLQMPCDEVDRLKSLLFRKYSHLKVLASARHANISCIETGSPALEGRRESRPVFIIAIIATVLLCAPILSLLALRAIAAKKRKVRHAKYKEETSGSSYAIEQENVTQG